nr:hypothetical protein GCM10025730_02760 [Promicromonospora thailandica]
MGQHDDADPRAGPDQAEAFEQAHRLARDGAGDTELGADAVERERGPRGQLAAGDAPAQRVEDGTVQHRRHPPTLVEPIGDMNHVVMVSPMGEDGGWTQTSPHPGPSS